MHVIQVQDIDGAVLSENSYQERDVAFDAFDRAVEKAKRGPGAGDVEIVMSDDGKIHRRHRVTRREYGHAKTDQTAAAARDGGERPRGEAAQERRVEPVPAATADRPPGGRPAKATDRLSGPKRTDRGR